MKRVVSLVASLSALSMAMMPSAAASKESKTNFPPVERPTSFPQVERDYDAVFSGRPAVQRIRVPGGLFLSQPLNDLAPQSLLAQQIEVDIRSEIPTLADLQMLLEVEGIHVTIDYQSLYEAAQASGKVGSFTAASKFQEVANSVKGGTGVQNNGRGGFGNSGDFGGSFGGESGGSNANVTVEGAAKEASEGAQSGRQQQNTESSGPPSIYNRVLPFRYFRGTVGDLMRRLENTGNIAVWYQDGIVIGGTRRYSVSVLQQQDIIQSVTNELRELGATNVVGSVGAGQVVYSSPPRTNNEMIEPYLRRMSGNMSEVTLQVALVTVAMSRDAERGFDWSALNFGLGANVSIGPEGSGGNGGEGMGSTPRLANGAFTLSSNALNANLGDIFGINRVTSIAGAINFLSSIGDTSVAQNVELRTLSGSPVILRSGEDIPYVSGLGAVGGGFGGGFRQNTETERLGTGLTMNVDPRYDHTSGIVTMDIGLKLVDLVEFVQLDAGQELGTLTQPRTREQGINSILRIPAGQTTILGGIRRELNADSRTGPLGMFGIGSRKRDHEVFWLFAVVRPVVTVYETADSPIAPRSILDTRTTINPYDEGSYGVMGQPGPAVPVYNDAGVSADGGVPSYYGQGAVTPANRMPAGVTTSATPAPRGIVVPGAATPPEVNANIPSGAVLRDPGAAGENYRIETPTTPTAPAPAYPVPAPSDSTVIPQAGEMASGAAVPVIDGQSPEQALSGSRIEQLDASMIGQAAPQPRRSFIRAMSQNEKVN